MENFQTNWSRRDLLKTIAVLTGGAVVGGSLFMQGCKSNGSNVINFSPTQISLLDEIGETIIPTTDSPGAKAAKIGEFMKTIVSDCYTGEQQKAFTVGLDGFDDLCKKQNSKSFLECSAEQRKAFLVSLEKEAKPFDDKVDRKSVV